MALALWAASSFHFANPLVWPHHVVYSSVATPPGERLRRDRGRRDQIIA
jgi:hypothetical protein